MPSGGGHGLFTTVAQQKLLLLRCWPLCESHNGYSFINSSAAAAAADGRTELCFIASVEAAVAEDVSQLLMRPPPVIRVEKAMEKVARGM